MAKIMIELDDKLTALLDKKCKDDDRSRKKMVEMIVTSHLDYMQN